MEVGDFVFTSVRIKRINFKENIRAFGRDKRKCRLYTGVSSKWVFLERGSIVRVFSNTQAQVQTPLTSLP